jgi:hypothetical protein
MYEPDEDPPGDAPHDSAALRAVPDLGGLPVEDATGIPVGRLFGALVETETGLVRYIDLSLEALDRHVLVPIGHARVREEGAGHCIRLRAALLEELEQIPPFPADVAHVDDPFERALLEAYGRSFHGERYYAHPSYDHHGIYVGEHPIVGEGQVEDDTALKRLSYMPGWRVAKGEQDIRGWHLRLDDGAEVGIRDLVVEPATEAVRYVVTDTADGKGSRLLPIGYLAIDAKAKLVHTDCLTAEDLASLPEYEGGGVARAHEDRLHRALRGVSGRRRYRLPDYRSPQAEWHGDGR